MPVELLVAVEAVGEPYYLGRNGLFDLLKSNARLNVIPYKNSVFSHIKCITTSLQKPRVETVVYNGIPPEM